MAQSQQRNTQFVDEVFTLIVPCLRLCGLPHHCGDPDPSRTSGQTSEDFSNAGSQKVQWKVNKHGESQMEITLGLNSE